MNSRERMFLAMNHTKADRVPVMCQLAIGHYFLNTNIEPLKIWNTSEGFSDALVQMQKRYDFDGILVNIWGMPYKLLDYADTIEKENVNTTVTWKNGEITIFPADDNAHHYTSERSDLERADFDSINIDNLDAIHDISGYFWNMYQMPNLPELTQNFKPGEMPDYLFKTLRMVREKIGDSVSLHGEVGSPFTHYVELFGYEEALMSLITNPEKAHKILTYLSIVAAKHGYKMGKEDVDAVLITSAFAGGPFLSREMYKEFIVPYEKELTDAVKETNKPVYTHTCGSIGDRLDLMIETGTMGIDTLDPPPLGNTDLKTALKELDGQVFVKGNMNAVDLLNFKTEEEVIEHAKSRINPGKPTNAYILSTACSVAPKTEPWKLELLAEVSKTIGKYE